MASLPIRAQQPWSVEEFLNWEEQQEARWELTEDGPWRMMVGAPWRHSLIVGNVFAAFHRQLRGKPCDAHRESFKVLIKSRIYYPDVVVRCGPIDPNAQFTDRPRVVVEVLSPSTENRDLTEKKRNYLAVPGLAGYVVVYQRPQLIELYLPSGGTVPVAEIDTPGLSITIPDLELTLTFDETFEGVPEVSANE